MMKWLVLCGVVLGSGLALLPESNGDAGSGSSGTQPSNPAPTELVVTESDPDVPARCRPRRLGEALIRWNRALNAGDTKTLRRFWKEEKKGLRNDRGSHARGTFTWFSVDDSPSPTHDQRFVAFKPRRALRYVRTRGGFRLQLTDSVGIGGFQGRWLLDDGSVRQVIGKAVILCKRRKQPLIETWTMRVVEPGGERPWDECPNPPGGAPPGTLVACASGTSRASER